MPLCQAQQLLGDASRGSQLATHSMECPEAPEYLRDLGRLTQLPAKLASPDIDAANLRSCVAFGGNQRNTQSELKRKLLTSPLRRVRQPFEKFQSSSRESDGFLVTEAKSLILSRL